MSVHGSAAVSPTSNEVQSRAWARLCRFDSTVFLRYALSQGGVKGGLCNDEPSSIIANGTVPTGTVSSRVLRSIDEVREFCAASVSRRTDGAGEARAGVFG